MILCSRYRRFLNVIDQLERELANLCAETSGIKIAYAIETPLGRLSQNADIPLPAASLIKLAIAAYGASQHSSDAFLTKQIRLKNDDIVGGAGVIRFLNQREFSIADLTTLMLRDSDNTAANALINFYGLVEINKWLKLNVTGAELNRLFMSPVIDRDNTITPRAALRLLSYCLDFGGKKYKQITNNALHHSTSTTQMTFPIISGEFQGSSANKSGTLPTASHEAVRLTTGSQSIDAVVMTTFPPELRSRSIILQQRISRRLLQTFTP